MSKEVNPVAWEVQAGLHFKHSIKRRTETHSAHAFSFFMFSGVAMATAHTSDLACCVLLRLAIVPDLLF